MTPLSPNALLFAALTSAPDAVTQASLAKAIRDAFDATLTTPTHDPAFAALWDDEGETR